VHLSTLVQKEFLHLFAEISVIAIKLDTIVSCFFRGLSFHEDMNFVAIDFETANSNRSSVCAIGIAMVHNGELLDTTRILIKPVPNYYDSFNSTLHGINDGLTRKEPTFQDQWADLKEYFEGMPIVAHDAAFNCGALRAALDYYELEYPNVEYHCTYQLAKATLNLQAHTIDFVAKYFDIELHHHEAESEARAAALVAIRLCEKHQVNSLEELTAKLGFKPGKIMRNTRSLRPYSKR
jgi:DNA polymerase-3 subunit epsilon